MDADLEIVRFGPLQVAICRQNLDGSDDRVRVRPLANFCLVL